MLPRASRTRSKLLASRRRRCALSGDEGHFDRVEVRAVGRQEQEPAAPLAQTGCGPWAAVSGQVVEDYHRARVEDGCELGFDVGVEGIAIHRAGNDPGRDQLIASQACHKGLAVPAAERGRAIEALAFGAAPP